MELLDYDAAASRLGVSTRFLRDLVYRHEIGLVRLGRLVRFRPSDLDAYIERRAVEPQRAS